MPWSVKKDDRCPTEKPWGVVKDDGDELVACHASEDDAKKQQAALYANEPQRSIEFTNEPTERSDPMPEDEPIPPADIRRATSNLRVEDEGMADGRLGTLYGTVARYGEWAEVDSAVEGHFMESIERGAFTKTFGENRQRMQVIYDHGLDRSIGRKPMGPLEDVFENSDDTITYRAKLLDTSYNRDLLPALKEPGVMGSSFHARDLKGVYRSQRTVKASDYNPKGLAERVIREMRVIELGPTPFPVYAGTSAVARSITDEYAVARIWAEDPEAIDRLLSHVRKAQDALQPGAEAEPHSVERSRVEPTGQRFTTRFKSSEEFIEWLETQTS